MSVSRRFTLFAGLASGLGFAGAAHAQSGRRRRGPAAASAAPMAADDFEANAYKVLEHIGENQQHYNVSRDDGRLLRMLAENAGPKRIVEIGTSTGYSGIWLGLALKKTGGKLTTFEIDRERAAMAQANFRRAGLAETIEVVIGDAVVETKKLSGSIDLVFSDADKENYLNYFRIVSPLLRKGGLFVSDNMRIPSPDPEYLKAITSDKAFDTVFVNMDRTGMGISLKKL